jgi:hypothetical protein
VAEALGYQPAALITKWRFFDLETDSFDFSKYTQKIWTPDNDPVPGFGGWEKFEIPPHRAVWADLDFEKWECILQPDTCVDEAVAARVEDYLQLIQATRTLRPDAQVCLHGLVRSELGGESGALIEGIVSRCDAVSPSLQSNLKEDLGNVQQQMEIKRIRVRESLKLKRDHGVKVLPLVHKRYRLLDEDGNGQLDEHGRKIFLLAPPEVLEQMMEVVFTTQVDGLKVDGVIVWSVDNRVLNGQGDGGSFAIPDTPDQQTADQTDIQFLNIIEAVAQEHWDPSPPRKPQADTGGPGD